MRAANTHGAGVSVTSLPVAVLPATLLLFDNGFIVSEWKSFTHTLYPRGSLKASVLFSFFPPLSLYPSVFPSDFINFINTSTTNQRTP